MNVIFSELDEQLRQRKKNKWNTDCKSIKSETWFMWSYQEVIKKIKFNVSSLKVDYFIKTEKIKTKSYLLCHLFCRFVSIYRFRYGRCNLNIRLMLRILYKILTVVKSDRNGMVWYSLLCNALLNCITSP